MEVMKSKSNLSMVDLTKENIDTKNWEEIDAKEVPWKIKESGKLNFVNETSQTDYEGATYKSVKTNDGKVYFFKKIK